MNSSKKILAAMCLLAFGGSAFAATISISPGTATALQAGSATSPTPHTIQYVPEAGDQTGNVQARITYDQTRLTPTLTAGDPVCSNPAPGLILVVTQNNTVNPLPAGSLCSISFASVAAAPLGVTNLDLQFDAGAGDGCFENTMGNPTTCTLNDATVEIISAPPDVTLSFTPAPGATVTFPGGTALTTSNTSIAVAAGGTVGSGTVTGCTITGAGAAAFGTPPADITVAAGASGSLPLSCTLPNSGGAATATLTCTETDSNTPAPGAARTWPLSCPQGTPVPGPGFGATPAPNPAPAAPILCNGQAGDSVQRQITITNNGNAGAGSALDFTCTGGGIVSIVSGGTATGLAVGASQTVTVACAVPGDGVTSTGTVSCTSNAPGAPFVFNYSSTGSTFPPPVPRPAVVPASSTWSQIALIALLAGLGLAFVGFRRGQ